MQERWDGRRDSSDGHESPLQLLGSPSDDVRPDRLAVVENLSSETLRFEATGEGDEGIQDTVRDGRKRRKKAIVYICTFRDEEKE